MIAVEKLLVEKLLELKKPAIVAISGFGGSGKSTFANALGRAINAPIISVDEFAKDNTRDDYTHWESMDFKRFEDEVLAPFHKCVSPLRYGHYDWGVNAIIKIVEVPHHGVLVVEGVGLFRPELSKYFSYKIWIDCQQEEATIRGKKRDREVYRNPQDGKWDGIWKRMDTEYFEKYRPNDVADLVISNHENKNN